MIFRSPADKFKIISSYIIGGAAVIFCLYTAATDGARHPLQILLCIFGGAIGWCIGLYLTPSSEGEKKQLSEFSKALLTLLSGFGLGNINEIAAVIKQWAPPTEQESSLRILLFLCTLVIGALFTYISRLFVKGEEEALRQQRAKSITQLRESLDKLENQN